MRKTEGFNSDNTFLKVINFDPSPAAFTPKNLNDFEKDFALFLFPLLCFTFDDIILITFLLFDFILFVSSSCLQVLGFLKPSEKPTQVYH